MDPVTNTGINLSWEVLLLCHSSDIVAKQPLYGGLNYYWHPLAIFNII